MSMADISLYYVFHKVSNTCGRDIESNQSTLSEFEPPSPKLSPLFLYLK